MTDVINITKKAFTWSVVVMTIAWSMGLAALAPLAANAATCSPVSAGDVIQSAGSNAVWVVTSDLKRMAFPNSHVYHTWYPDFSGLEVLSVECYSNIQAASQMVKYRPGSFPVRFDGNNHVYVVGENGMLHWVKDGAFLKTLYGENSLKPFGQAGGQLVGILPLFESSYTIGADLDTLKLHNGMLVKVAGSSDVWSVMGGKLHKVTGTLASFVAVDVRTVSQALVDALEVGADVTAASITADPTQGAVTGSTPGEPVYTGNVTVGLAANTPAGVNLASGSAFNPVLRVTLQAGAEALKVDGFTFTKSGFIANNKVAGIELVDSKGMRHGNVATSIDSDNKVTIVFSSNPIMVPAGQSETVTVRINAASDATSGSLSLSIASKDDVDTSATVGGSFPITGGTFYFIDAGSSIASTTVDVQSVSGASGTTLNVNDASSQEITKFEIAETSSQEGVEVTALRLTNQGNADDTDYKDVQLVKTDGTVIGTAQPDGDEVYFDLSASPLRVEEGENESVTVRATVIDGTTKTIHFVIEDDYDVALRGLETGLFVLPHVGSSDAVFPIGDSIDGGTTTTYNKVTIGAGTLSFNKAGDSPSSAIAPGTNNAVIAKYVARPTGEDYELRKVELAIVKGGSVSLTGSYKITVNGKSVYSAAVSSLSTSSGSPTSVTLSSYATLKSGVDSVIEVSVNVADTATSSDSYTAYLDLTQTKKLISNVTGDPSVSQVAGNIMAVDTASLTLSTLSSPVAQSTVAGVNDFHFATIELNATGSGADVRVSGLTVTDTLGTPGEGHLGLNNLRLYRDGVIVPTSNSTQTNATTTVFTFVNALVVPKNGTITLQLKANVVSIAGVSHTFAATDVSATNKATGETVTETLGSGTGQTMTVSGTGSVALSLVSGTNGAPTTAQIIPIGTTDGIYFAFKVTALNEGMKVRSLKLTASGTVSADLVDNDLRNIRLYSSLDNYATPVATAAQLSCTLGVCTTTWTAGDNILPSPIMPGTPVTFRVKADIGNAGSADLGDNFVFRIASSTGDITFVGNSTGSTLAGSAIAGSASASSYSHITPFSVVATAVSPAAPVELSTGAGAVVGVYKVTNNGTSKITVTDLGFGNNGTATTSYSMYSSADGGSSSDISNTVSSTISNAGLAAVGSLSVTIEGGSWRYFTIKTGNTANNFDTNDLGVTAIGSLLYSVSEADLGYSADPSSNSNLTNTAVSGLGIDGKPSTEAVTHRNN